MGLRFRQLAEQSLAALAAILVILVIATDHTFAIDENPVLAEYEYRLVNSGQHLVLPELIINHHRKNR